MQPSSPSASAPARAAHHQRLFSFAPDVAIRIDGPDRVLSYFDAEYGPLAISQCGAPAIDLIIESYRHGTAAVRTGAPESLVVRRRHKVTWWALTLNGLEDETTRMAFSYVGPMGLPYLQNFYLEPLLRLKLLQAGLALVHGCALAKGSMSVLFAGGSSVGKTTLALRQAAQGRAILGDNYIILSREGETFRFPRRLRIHSDIRETNTEVHRLMARRERAWLSLSRIIRALSLGYADLTCRLSIQRLVPNCVLRKSATLDSTFVLTPHAGTELVGPVPIGVDELVRRIQAHSLSEGLWLAEAMSAHYRSQPSSRLRDLPEVERDILREATGTRPMFEFLIPRVADPGALVDHIGRLSGLDA